MIKPYIFAAVLVATMPAQAKSPAQPDVKMPDTMQVRELLNKDPAVAAAIANLRVAPVSYTHLTLPTSDLV